MMKEGWRRWSACRGMDPDVFFPPLLNDQTALPARAVCADCPVRGPCLDYALSISAMHGIWAGTTEKERDRIRRRRNRERHQLRIASGDIVPPTTKTTETAL